jgi:hypothetical protein
MFERSSFAETVGKHVQFRNPEAKHSRNLPMEIPFWLQSEEGLHSQNQREPGRMHCWASRHHHEIQGGEYWLLQQQLGSDKT